MSDLARQLLEVFPKNFVSRHISESIAKVCQAEAIHPLDQLLVSAPYLQPATIERAMEFIRQTTHELSNRGKRKIAFCPAGGFTLEALRGMGREPLQIELFDNFKALQHTQLEGLELFPVEALARRHHDCLFIGSSLHTGALLDQLARTHVKILQRVKLPFFPDFEVIADPGRLGFTESKPLLADRKALTALFSPHSCNCGELLTRAYFEQQLGEKPDWLLDETLAKRCGRADALVLGINQLCREAHSGKALILAAYRFAFNYVKHAMALRKQGYRVILLALEDNVNESTPLSAVDRFFDGVFSTAGDWEEYCMVLSGIEPSLIHAVSMIRLNEFGLLVSGMAKTPVVVEFNDITSHGHTLDDLVALIGPEQAEEQFEMEGRICRTAAGIVDKDRPDAVVELLTRHKAATPYLSFPSYASPELFENKDPDPYCMSVVYVGGVNSSVGLDSANPTTTLIHAADTLSEQGIRFRIMNVYDNGRDPRFESYLRKAAESYFFSYVPSQPIHLVPKLISAYSYGWLVFDLSKPDRRREFYKTALASKFFTYLEADLPVICSEELEHLAGIIRSYNIGFSISWGDLANLAAIARRQDLSQQRANVLNYRELINMDNQISRLAHFYDDLLSANHPTGEKNR